MRNNTSARNRIKIQNAVMEIMERRTLFTAAPITLDPAFGTGGEVSQILTPAGTGQLTATNPLNGNVFVVGVNQDTQTISSPYNIQEFTSAGTIVASFGNGGLAAGSVHDAVPLAQETPVAAAVQSDGKLLVLSANIPTYEIQELYLTRYTTAGLPDPTFGTDGTLVYGTSYSPFFGPGETFHLMPNGNIAILGSIVGNNGSITSSVTMFTSAGVLDKSFGTNGVATGIAGSIDNLSVDSSGNLIAVGFVANITPYSDSPNVGLVERFTPAGKLDTTFGNAGSLVAPNASAFVTAYIGSTGITVSGYPPASSSAALELNQYTLSGKPITSFGSGKGYVSPQLNASIGTSSLVQPDGKLLVFGTLNDANEDAVAVRLNTDGSLDTTFGSDGYDNLGTDINSGQSLEPDGQIVLPGTNLSRPSADFNPVRLLANGSPDPSFGIDGTATGRASLTTGDAVAELPDGQTLVAGEAGSLGGILIERFNANGSPDSTFAPGQGFAGQNGYIYVGPEALPSNSSTNVDAMTVDSSGRIYLDEAGVGILRFDTNGQLDKTFGTHGIYENANADGMLVEASDQILISTGTNTLVRLNANGQIDNTFGSSGTAALPTAFSQNAGVFAVQSDGKILVGGSTNVTALGNSTDMAVVRLNSSGSIDASFGTAGMAIADKLPEEDVAGAPAGYSASSSALAVLSGGTIVLAGAGGQSFHAGNAVGPTIAEFLPTGQLNSAFGTDGQTSAFVPAGESTASGQSLIVQNDGTLVVAGTSYAGGEPYMSSSFLIVRYAADGTVDSDLVNNFAPTDPNSQGFGPFTSFSQAVAGPNGTIVAVGSLMPDPFTGPVGPVLADDITEADTLTGTVIGTPDSYENKGNTIANVFDGNLTNFFDAPTASGNYVGLDLGAAKVITQISYAPRPGFAYRMDGGIFQASNSATFTSGDVTLFTITHAPPTGVLTAVAISNPNAYRFIRYVGPANSYCNIAEMQLAGTSAATVIGTSGSYENHGNTIANVFDGNLTTFFDAPTASGAWVGLDLGSTQAITEVSFAPRPGWDSRMVGGEIQASNSANFSSGVVTVYTITAAPPAGVLTTATFASVGAYQYWRYMGPANGYCNIAELVFDVG